MPATKGDLVVNATENELSVISPIVIFSGKLSGEALPTVDVCCFKRNPVAKILPATSSRAKRVGMRFSHIGLFIHYRDSSGGGVLLSVSSSGGSVGCIWSLGATVGSGSGVTDTVTSEASLSKSSALDDPEFGLSGSVR